MKITYSLTNSVTNHMERFIRILHFIETLTSSSSAEIQEKCGFVPKTAKGSPLPRVNGQAKNISWTIYSIQFYRCHVTLTEKRLMQSSGSVCREGFGASECSQRPTVAAPRS